MPIAQTLDGSWFAVSKSTAAKLRGIATPSVAELYENPTVSARKCITRNPSRVPGRGDASKVFKLLCLHSPALRTPQNAQGVGRSGPSRPGPSPAGGFEREGKVPPDGRALPERRVDLRFGRDAGAEVRRHLAGDEHQVADADGRRIAGAGGRLGDPVGGDAFLGRAQRGIDRHEVDLHGGVRGQ